MLSVQMKYPFCEPQNRKKWFKKFGMFCNNCEGQMIGYWTDSVKIFRYLYSRPENKSQIKQINPPPPYPKSAKNPNLFHKFVG